MQGEERKETDRNRDSQREILHKVTFRYLIMFTRNLHQRRDFASSFTKFNSIKSWINSNRLHYRSPRFIDVQSDTTRSTTKSVPAKNPLATAKINQCDTVNPGTEVFSFSSSRPFISAKATTRIRIRIYSHLLISPD